MHTPTLLAAALLSLSGLVAAKDKKCPSKLPVPEFIIHNRGQTHNYAVTVSGPNNKHITKHVKKASASHFGIEEVCDGNICQLDQLTYYHGKPSTGQVAYGAYVKGPGKIYFLKDNNAALKAGYTIVTAAYSPSECKIVLIPFLDHDNSNLFDCGGVLSVAGGKSLKGCRPVSLTPGTANLNKTTG